MHPTRVRVAFDPHPYQRAFLECQAPRRIILKARQIGYSQVFALDALHLAITQPESTILLVSRSQDLAANLLRYCYLTHGNLRSAPALTKQNESEMGLANGSRIKSLPANRETGRGFAATAIYLDEFAYADYAEDIYQSVSPAVAQGGRLTIGSTPNGVGNLFHALWVSDASFWQARTPWWRCPSYNPDGYAEPDDAASQAIGEQGAWYQTEHPNYTAQQWAAEYECDFAGSGQAVFQTAAIAAAEDGAWGDRQPQPSRRYVGMVDIGRRQDATVINVVDATDDPYQRVFHERMERVPYPRIQQAIDDAARRYPGAWYVESNGVGDPVIENLTVAVTPFVTTARSKTQAIQALQLLFERCRLKARWTPQERRELTLYRWDDRDLIQDCVMSLAIGAAHLDRPRFLFASD